ncbi:50S ribosomal protein L6 [Candidatus Saccharibacteria bacterium]|nr:50S ribosomal protein L6 [Candidatus Saccharibacteria bacterium]
MSRVGKSPITVPSGVNVSIADDVITVTGSKGTLSEPQIEDITVKLEDNVITVTRANDMPKIRAKHGLMRALINNMVVGVSEGFSKQLEIKGVGYRVAQAGTDLKLNVGFSHDIMYPIPQGVKVDIQGTVMTVSGISRQQVGQVAAEIRAIKKPEPYKGKGIMYVGERILRKSGKSGKEK